jgi:hypothetical protein
MEASESRVVDEKTRGTGPVLPLAAKSPRSSARVVFVAKGKGRPARGAGDTEERAGDDGDADDADDADEEEDDDDDDEEEDDGDDDDAPPVTVRNGGLSSSVV